MRTAIMALTAVILSIAGPARADNAEEEARIQFQNGVKLYDDGSYEQAAIAFDRAYELKPSYKILFNIGQSRSELKHYAEALKAYTKYLEEGGEEVPEERREQVNAEIKRLEALVGMIVVETDKKGATVLVDKEERGQTPLLGPVFVDLGKHEVIVELGRERLLERIVEVAGGERVLLKLEEQPLAGVEPAKKTSLAEEQREDGPSGEEGPGRVWTWVAFAVGGAAAIGAGITGGLAISRASDLEKSCPDKECSPDKQETVDSGKRLGVVTNALIGVAAAGAVTTLILFFLEPKRAADNEAVTINAAPGGGIITVGGTF
jgi:hypothetical protein